jgi:hypothetical protein
MSVMAYRSPAARAPDTPQDRACTMPPDVSALAGSDLQDRVLGGALHGTNRPNPAALLARQSGPGSNAERSCS